VVYRVDNPRDQDVGDEEFKDGIRHRQSSGDLGPDRDAHQSLVQRTQGAAALIEMTEQHHHEEHAKYHVNGDAAAQDDERQE